MAMKFQVSIAMKIPLEQTFFYLHLYWVFCTYLSSRISVYIFFFQKNQTFPQQNLSNTTDRSQSHHSMTLWQENLFAFPQGFNFISSSELFSNYRGSSSVVNTNDQNVYSDTQNIPRILIHSISNLHFDCSMFLASIFFFWWAANLQNLENFEH